MSITENKGKAFRRWGIATIIAVYVLILVGGIVRSTGSGMGCPDWPKCFGQYVPPTDISQLPDNYKDVFANKRKEKNARLVKYIRLFGYDELADKVMNDPNVYVEQDFNPTKTWIEYVNRLVGVVIGLLIFATFLTSFSYFKSKPVIFWLSGFSVILTGFQGWIGSIVVSTNLLQGMITLHMFLAILMVVLLIYAVYRSYDRNLVVEQNIGNKALLKVVLWFTFIITFAQTILGTQVRELIDVVADQLGEAQRNNWVNGAGAKFLIHRSFSWVVLGVNVLPVYLLWKGTSERKLIFKNMQVLLLITILQIVSGAAMGYWGIPPYLQPLHLLLSIIMLGQQFFVILALQKPKVFTEAKNSTFNTITV